jgi:hypothetical protein
MVATLYRAQFAVPLYGDPAQNSSNTWYFFGAVGSSRADDVDEIFARLEGFYQAIDSVIYPQSVVGSTGTIVQYDMSDPEPRTPIAGPDNITLGNSAAGAYPSDVAICLSYHAAYPSGANRARRRGRVYLGPVVASTATAVAGQGQRVSQATVDSILGAVDYLTDQVLTPITWAVYSETDGVGYPIVECSIDNGFDTRRTRDNRATTRTTKAV